jgi:hypothetical protein
MWRFEDEVFAHVFDPAKAQEIRELWAHPERKNTFSDIVDRASEEQDRNIADLYPEERERINSVAEGKLALTRCDPKGAAHSQDVVRVDSSKGSVSRKDIALLIKLCEQGVIAPKGSFLSH